MLPHSLDGLAASLPGKDDISLDSLMLNRPVNSQEFSLSAASPFSLKRGCLSVSVHDFVSEVQSSMTVREAA